MCAASRARSHGLHIRWAGPGRGDYVESIDADLQDPPETIPAMLGLARERRLDVVYGVRSDRSTDTVFKRNSARMFEGLFRRASTTEAVSHAGDFRVMSPAPVNAVNRLPEHSPGSPPLHCG